MVVATTRGLRGDQRVLTEKGEDDEELKDINEDLEHYWKQKENLKEMLANSLSPSADEASVEESMKSM